jgi:pyruvate dehydrogenase E1 component alpha subunit
MSMHVNDSMNIPDLSIRAQAYGMKGWSVDGNDVMAVWRAAVEGRAHVEKNGPGFLVANTYRIMGHSKSDGNKYRDKTVIESWKERCPIKRMRDWLLEEKVATEAEIVKTEALAKQSIEDALAFAEASPEPELESALTDVYAD